MPWNKGVVTTPLNPGHSPLMQWLNAHLNYEGEGCLTWPFARNPTGYGNVGRRGTAAYAHRLMCEAVNGPPPTPKHQAAHSCGNGHLGCVHPKHLSWKTPSDNQREGRWHPKRKLNEQNVAEILRLKGEVTPLELATRFGVTEATVRKVQAGMTWATARRERQFTHDEVIAIRALPNARAVSQEAIRLGAHRNAVARIWKRQTYRHV